MHANLNSSLSCLHTLKSRIYIVIMQPIIKLESNYQRTIGESKKKKFLEIFHVRKFIPLSGRIHHFLMKFFLFFSRSHYSFTFIIFGLDRAIHGQENFCQSVAHYLYRSGFLIIRHHWNTYNVVHHTFVSYDMKEKSVVRTPYSGVWHCW